MPRLVRSPLARIRVKAGIQTTAEAAQLLGFSRSHLLHVERGRYGASKSLMEAMARKYGVPVETIASAIRDARIDLARRIAESL